MKRLIFISDILFHDPSYKLAYHLWVADMIQPAIQLSTGVKFQEFIKIKNKEDKTFNRNYFYELSSITDVSLSYYPYDIKKITEKSWDYFFSFIDQDDLLIGVELGTDLREILTTRGIQFINFWFHSFHLFQDWCFMLNTNDKKLYDKIRKYIIPYEKFQLYAFIAQRILSARAEKLPLSNNCCVFIGQTFQDKSVEKNGVFLNITHFEKELDELSKQYSKIYYVPHPSVANARNETIEQFLKTHPYIEVLKNIPTYVLLSSPKVKEVIGISSSVLYEAKYFKKKIRYLYQPLFDIDSAFGLNTFISVYNNYLNPDFWCTVLDGLFPIRENNRYKNIYDPATSCVREVANSYHGYRYIDRYMKMVDKTNGLQTICKNLDQKLNDLNAEVNRKENTVVALWQKIKTSNKSRVYILGIPVYKCVKRNRNKTIYIFGIPVYQEDGMS